MAPGRAAPGRARGGEDIQAPRPRDARLATGLAALLVAAALVAATMLRESGGVDRGVLLAVGVAGLLILLLALASRWSGAITGALVALGAQQAVRLELGTHALDVWAPLLAAALLLCAELAWWSIERRVPAWAQPGLALRRLVTILVMCCFGAAVGAVMLVAAGASLSGGVGLELAGIVAATGAVALVVYTARSSP